MAPLPPAGPSSTARRPVPAAALAAPARQASAVRRGPPSPPPTTAPPSARSGVPGAQRQHGPARRGAVAVVDLHLGEDGGQQAVAQLGRGRDAGLRHRAERRAQPQDDPGAREGVDGRAEVPPHAVGRDGADRVARWAAKKGSASSTPSAAIVPAKTSWRGGWPEPERTPPARPAPPSVNVAKAPTGAWWALNTRIAASDVDPTPVRP